MHWLGTLLRALSFLKLAWPKLLEFVDYVKKQNREKKLRRAMKNDKITMDPAAIEQFLASRGMSDRSNKAKRDAERKGKDPSQRPDKQ
jgi:hypothetical protein